MTCLLPVLKEQGWHITINGSQRILDVMRHNPHVDVFLKHDESIPPDERLKKHLQEINKDYDKAIDLSESIEGSLAKVEWRDDFYQSPEDRHKECNVNFYDKAFEVAGLDVKGKNGELYFSSIEHKMAREIRRKFKGKFLILWTLSGSSVHKAYPYAEFVMKALLDRHKDVVILQIGEGLCGLLELTGHPRAKCYSGVWPIRKSLIMTQYVDLVIGPDTGIMHGAGCFDTPKILFLSSNTKENLSKYWKNCVELVGPATCHPCHRLHYSKEHCIMDRKLDIPVCMSLLEPRTVFMAIENFYQKRRKDKCQPQALQL